jgi:parallel beta-helix repeat protein
MIKLPIFYFIMFSFVFITNLHSRTILVPSKELPTITKGLIKAREGDTVMVKPGEYKENINLLSGSILVSQELHKAIINGKGRGNVITISHRSSISGFTIKNGRAGIMSRGPGNIISKCKILKNRGSGIICMTTLPTIENNIIIYNEGSGIQCIDINAGVNEISHNTIAYNTNHGISVISTSAITIQNNIISHNSAHGVKLSPVDSTTKIINNVFWDNHFNRVVGIEDNFEFDPKYIEPHRKSLNFGLESTSEAIKKGNDNLNCGANL